MVLDDYDTEHTIKFEKIYNVCANDYLKDVAIMFAKEQLQDYEMEFQNVHIDNLIDDFMTTVSNIQNSFNNNIQTYITPSGAVVDSGGKLISGPPEKKNE